MTSVARSTIAKAVFFLDRAEESGANERVAFCNYLEVAIVLTRSVTFHLQKEFANRPEFDNWYKDHQKSLSQNQLCRFLLNQRNYLLKEGPINTHRLIEMNITESVHVSCSVTVTVMRGAPWYKRSLKTLWQDTTYRLRAMLHSFQVSWSKSKARKRLEQSSSQVTEQDHIYFSAEQWKSEPAIKLVRRALAELEVIVLQAEHMFLFAESLGSESVADQP
jgi:hypothetical protein